MCTQIGASNLFFFLCFSEIFQFVILLTSRSWVPVWQVSFWFNSIVSVKLSVHVNNNIHNEYGNPEFEISDPSSFRMSFLVELFFASPISDAYYLVTQWKVIVPFDFSLTCTYGWSGSMAVFVEERVTRYNRSHEAISRFLTAWNESTYSG